MPQTYRIASVFYEFQVWVRTENLKAMLHHVESQQFGKNSQDWA